ncbi:hypothetical protein [uncultured Tateyamaria sp.]|uniref:hypothetical protein n=1 Tax=uncultured Tateyamaria sp. TaxID=455651 RepID=UPI002624FA95|nr:hypothetical protein [uncultured Tateyamaria sp.]
MSDAGASPPVFLEQRGYRRRRLMDALRLLPIAGIALWLLPVFWPTVADGPDAPEPMAMSSAIVYVFVVWIGLIMAAFALWAVLFARRDTSADQDDEAL